MLPPRWLGSTDYYWTPPEGSGLSLLNELRLLGVHWEWIIGVRVGWMGRILAPRRCNFTTRDQQQQHINVEFNMWTFITSGSSPLYLPKEITQPPTENKDAHDMDKPQHDDWCVFCASFSCTSCISWATKKNKKQKKQQRMNKEEEKVELPIKVAPRPSLTLANRPNLDPNLSLKLNLLPSLKTLKTSLKSYFLLSFMYCISAQPPTLQEI